MCGLVFSHSQNSSSREIKDDREDLLDVLSNHRYYRKLIRAIEEHPYKEQLAFLHSSLIVRGGSILSIGINTPEQNGFCRAYTEYDQTQLHAEFHAVGKIRNKVDLRGCTIYNLRLRRDGNIAMSKPCSSCERMLTQYGFKKAVYTTENSIELMKFRR